MKTRLCESIQIFPFQLLLFWWAYCCWFPWHPAAILQLLILTNRKREGERGLSSPLRSSFFFFFFYFWRRKCGGSKRSVSTVQIKMALLGLLISSSGVIMWFHLNLSYMDRSKVNPWGCNWCSCHWCFLQTLWKRKLFTETAKYLMSPEWGQSYWPWHLMLLKACCRNQATWILSFLNFVLSFFISCLSHVRARLRLQV